MRPGDRHRAWQRLGGLALCVAVLGAGGCAAPRLGLDAHRLAPYRPDADGIQLVAAVPVPVAVAPVVTQAVANVSTAAPPVEVASLTATNRAVVEATVSAAAVTNLPPDPGASNAVVAAVVEVGSTLHRGSKVLIRLRGIPEAEEFTDQIDDLGEVTFTLIGPIKIAGLTTAEAEHLVAKTYLDRKIYNQINVIITAEEEEYFVQGEVRRPGKYTFTRKVTLLQTISEAGGFTPFANKRKIKVMKDQTKEFAVYDAKAIADGNDVDPTIGPGDVIDVPRGWY